MKKCIMISTALLALAAMLKELGYEGVGHIWLDGLPERLKTLDELGYTGPVGPPVLRHRRRCPRAPGPLHGRLAEGLSGFAHSHRPRTNPEPSSPRLMLSSPSELS